MTHVEPARATRTRSIPTRVPEMNSVNSTSLRPPGVCRWPALPAPGTRRLHAVAPGTRVASTHPSRIGRPAPRQYNDRANCISSGYQQVAHVLTRPIPRAPRGRRHRRSIGRGRLLLTGADRRALSAGAAVQRHRRARPGTGCYAAYLTAQGRMIADMRVFETGGRAARRSRRNHRPGGRRSLVAVHLQRGRPDRRTSRRPPRRSASTVRAPRRCSRRPCAGGRRRASRRRTRQLLRSLPVYANARWNFGRRRCSCWRATTLA